MATKRAPFRGPGRPTAPIEAFTRPFVRFTQIEASSGVLLLTCAIVALVIANGPWAAAYQAWWDQHLTIKAFDLKLDYPLWYWVNDALMAIFFFVVGLEIKREIVVGELSDRERLTLPVVAAIGGATVPALIYFAQHAGGAAARGWAIPMATDIAFVVGCMALLGDRVPKGLKVLLLAVAVVDDLMAVVIIALFFTPAVKLAALGGAVGLLVMMAVMNRLGVRAVGVYVLVGAAVWVFTLKSGVHPTVAGVAMGLLTPASAWIAKDRLLDTIDAAVVDVRTNSPAALAAVEEVAAVAKESVSPLQRLEDAMHPWVAFVIMPLFALANANVPISGGVLGDPVALAVTTGLVIGKPVGIVAAAFVTVRLGLARLPTGVNWVTMAGGGVLCGIGFTMAVFIAGLALEGAALTAAKTGILLASALAAVVGMGLLALVAPAASARAQPEA
jgi:NhaA family Na+:H+ antiporter